MKQAERPKGWWIESYEKGYRLHLPDKLCAELAPGGDFEVSLDDGRQVFLTLRGDLRVDGREVSFTPNPDAPCPPFPPFPPVVPATPIGDWWLKFRGMGASAGSDCSGCPRDATLRIYGDDSICYCVLDKGTTSVDPLG